MTSTSTTLPAEPLEMHGARHRGRVLCIALDSKGARAAVPIAVDLAHGSGLDCSVIAAYAPTSSWTNPLLVSFGVPPIDHAALSRAHVEGLAGGRAARLDHVWIETRGRALPIAKATAAEGNVNCALVAYAKSRHRKLAERIVAELDPHCVSVMPIAADALPF
jgi:hypothetical protein